MRSILVRRQAMTGKEEEHPIDILSAPIQLPKFICNVFARWRGCSSDKRCSEQSHFVCSPDEPETDQRISEIDGIADRAGQSTQIALIGVDAHNDGDGAHLSDPPSTPLRGIASRRQLAVRSHNSSREVLLCSTMVVISPAMCPSTRRRAQCPSPAAPQSAIPPPRLPRSTS